MIGLMQNSDKTRDRAYVRHILIKQVDLERFVAHLTAIPRKGVISLCKPASDNFVWFHAKLKKEEILFLKLSFEVMVMKPNQKKPMMFKSSMWKPG